MNKLMYKMYYRRNKKVYNVGAINFDLQTVYFQNFRDYIQSSLPIEDVIILPYVRSTR